MDARWLGISESGVSVTCPECDCVMLTARDIDIVACSCGANVRLWARHG